METRVLFTMVAILLASLLITTAIFVSSGASASSTVLFPPSDIRELTADA